MKLPDNIEVRPDVMMGKPCFKGTRISVDLVLEKLGAGERAEEILAAYPQLERAHIVAALQYSDQAAD
jgi:uncharacterized protein (DUF433 family)